MRIFTIFFVVLFSFLIVEAKAITLDAPDGQVGGYFVDLENLKWNRYTTKSNFVVLSIDDNQGKWLSENIDRLKSFSLNRWGLAEFQSNNEIRIFCVPNYDLLKKLFSLNKSRIEKRDNLIVGWIVLESDLTQNLAPFLEEMVFIDCESSTKSELPFWFKRGAINLSYSAAKISQDLKDLKTSFDDKKLFSVDRVFKMDIEAFEKESEDSKKLYDQQATALCLMLRREFGGIKLRSFIYLCSQQGIEKSLQAIYRFNGVSHFNKQYLHYLRDLCSEASQDKILSSYLEIKPF